MDWIGVWWRQPDHFEWMSDYLASRGLKRFIRYLLAAIESMLAVATSLILISPSGPRHPAERAIVLAVIASLIAMAVIWLLRWPTQTQSRMFSIIGAAGIAVVCLVQPDPTAE